MSSLSILSLFNLSSSALFNDESALAGNAHTGRIGMISSRRRKTKRMRRMRGSGKKKRGRTKKCKCGPKCKSCGKYNCKKDSSCKCPQGRGKRRTRGGCGSRRNSRRIRGGTEEVAGAALEATPGTVGMSNGQFTLRWPRCSQGTVVKWTYSGRLYVSTADTDKEGGELYTLSSLI